MYDAQSSVVDRLFASYAAASDLNVALLDQETGLRGYALTGRDGFLTPYTDGQRTAAQLDPGCAGPRPTTRPCGSGGVAVDEPHGWRTDIASPRSTERAQREHPATRPVEEGKERFDEVRAATSRVPQRTIVDQRAHRPGSCTGTSALLFGHARWPGSACWSRRCR